MSNNIESKDFSFLRSMFWPIYRYEMKKFLPMALTLLLIVLNYTILRNAKDAIINTAPGSGPEVLSFLKGWAVMPSAILFVVVYSKLANLLSREKLFYSVVSFFLVFFAVFSWVLYPMRDSIHMSIDTLQSLKAQYPNIQWIIPMFGYWSFSLFYIFSELWGSSMISLLFWQFANEITSTVQAKRFYAMFILVANIATIAAGNIGTFLADYIKEHGGWEKTQFIIIGIVVISGIGIMSLYRWINLYVLTDPNHYSEANKKAKKKKLKLGVLDSFKYIIRTPYIAYIALIVICYGVSMNLIEAIWKYQIKIMYPDTNQNYRFMAILSQYTGYFAIILIIVTKNILHKFSWFLASIITPLIILVSGSMFLAFTLFKEGLSDIVMNTLGISVTMAAVWVGLIQNSVSKGTKYALFDPTKEMAYIPLDQELKVKGKAAVDVIGGRLGKAFGGYTQQVLLILTAGTIPSISPYLGGVTAAILLVWIFAVGKLSKLYNQKIEEKKMEEKSEEVKV